MKEVVDRWSSRRAFILAVTGAAVGLGNIWRFPYVAGENGGALFFLLYVFFVLAMGLPVMIAEIMIGRAGRRPPIQALAALAQERGRSAKWSWVAGFGLLTVFLVLSFYSVVSGWSIEYLSSTVQGKFAGASAENISHALDVFLANPWLVVLNHSLFMLLTMAVVAKGVSSGLERLNNWLMPLLYLLLVVLVIYAATTPGFGEALKWLFSPKFEELTPLVVVNALGHAFFTLAIGACALMAYGAYMPEDQSLVKAVVIVAVLDVLVAVLSGVAIFSVVFSHHLDPTSGPGLMFVALPIAFSAMPFGIPLLGAFFLLLLFATWTSSINLAEPMVASISTGRLSRPVAALIVGLCVWAAGLLPALSFSTLANVRPIAGMTFFDLVTSVPPDIFLPLGGLMIAWFAASVLDPEKAAGALGVGTSGFRLWLRITRYVAIPLVVLVLLSALVPKLI
ncbi:hypothetical protein R84981_002193 [Carnimonas sp. R-84981]|uniref:sodium-dependent transporter n=1 Tax=Carnimonas bestiolae TaxID=3402172 RepID=UPI003EDB8050